MGIKLVIAEKPSVAKAYADALGAKIKKDGYYESNQSNPNGNSDGNLYIVSWCIGHLLGLAEPQAYDERYAKWRKEDLPINPAIWKYTAVPSTKKQLKILTDLMKRPDVETIINGADAGREGELIFRLVYEHAKCKKPIKRLWISSMEESAIKEGFSNLRNGSDYERLNQAAKCRQQADWLVGMNYSRLFSIVYNANLRVGRVQTPTLAMVVERYDKISNFVKEPFYVVKLRSADTYDKGSGSADPDVDVDGSTGTLTVESEKLPDKTQAEAISQKCNGQTAVISSIKKQDKHISATKAL